MADLPSEILSNIISNLSISDCENVTAALGTKDTILEHRKSIVRYLSAAFTNVHGLLATMFDFDCILSGSRALEYFIPGSISEDSDWDFFISDNGCSVESMLYSFEISGVVWEDPTDCIHRLMDASIDNTVEISCGELMNMDEHLMKIFIMRRYKLVREYSRALRILDTIMETKESMMRRGNRRHIRVMRNGSDHPVIEYVRRSDLEPFEENSSYDRSVISGFIEGKSCLHKIQLIIGKYRISSGSEIELISKFYGTHILCFISPFYALHMYYSEAWEHKSISLSGTKSSLFRIGEAKKKYVDRGWTFIHNEEFPPVYRTIADPRCKMIIFYDMVDFFVGALNHYRRSHSGSIIETFHILNSAVQSTPGNIVSYAWTIDMSSELVLISNSKALENEHNMKNKRSLVECKYTTGLRYILAVTAKYMDVKLNGDFIDTFVGPEGLRPQCM